MTTPNVKMAGFTAGNGADLFLISGPCVIEDFDTTFKIASFLKNLTDELGIPYIFKASFDKANRSSINAYRGPGIERGLDILNDIKQKLNVPVISDVHAPEEVAQAAKVLDVLQIPALLCRQTDLILETAKSGLPVNIKKGQFLAPWDMKNVMDKAASTGNKNLIITERGTSFGYNNLTVDFRGINIMQQTGYPVVFDATHSVQLPGGKGTASDGQREFAPILAKAAVAAGADGIFLEVHSNPELALCDGPNSIDLKDLKKVLTDLKQIHGIVRKEA